jgi:hypothetical protein
MIASKPVKLEVALFKITGVANDYHPNLSYNA